MGYFLPVRPAPIDPELTELATGFTVREYELARDAGEVSRAGIADAIELRFTERYIAAAQGAPQHGFTMTAIACLMIEGLECFRQGLPSSRAEARLCFARSSIGLCPCGNLRPSGPRSIQTSAAVSSIRSRHGADGRLNGRGPLFDPPTHTINATEFLTVLQQILHDYCEGLKVSPWNSPEWACVRTRMDAICSDCRP
jgi:hypothetical protein